MFTLQMPQLHCYGTQGMLYLSWTKEAWAQLLDPPASSKGASVGGAAKLAEKTQWSHEKKPLQLKEEILHHLGWSKPYK